MKTWSEVSERRPTIPETPTEKSVFVSMVISEDGARIQFPESLFESGCTIKLEDYHAVGVMEDLCRRARVALRDLQEQAMRRESSIFAIVQPLVPNDVIERWHKAIIEIAKWKPLLASNLESAKLRGVAPEMSKGKMGIVVEASGFQAAMLEENQQEISKALEHAFGLPARLVIQTPSPARSLVEPRSDAPIHADPSTLGAAASRAD